jgi:hypothetical protein
MRETTSVPKNKKKINNEIILPLDKIAAHWNEWEKSKEGENVLVQK